MKLVRTRFDLYCKGDKYSPRTLKGMPVDLPIVPDVGELINIDGEPYFVTKRGWGFSTLDGQLYAYVDICKRDEYYLYS